MAKKELLFGVCGYGGAFNMGREHANGLHRTGRARLVAVCDPDVSRLEAARKDFVGVETYTSLRALLAKSEAQMVILITPHNTHAPLALQALKARRHVVVEKPMCLTYAEATGMMKAAREARRMVTVYHNRRWDLDYVTLRKLVDGGAIGDVFSVRCHMAGYGMKTDWWRADRKVSGGCLYDWGAHMVDWVLGLVPSKIDSITGFSRKLVWTKATNEDEAQAIIRFRNGAAGDVMVSHIRDVRTRLKWEVMGTKGNVIGYWGNQPLELTTRAKDHTVTEYVPLAGSTGPSYYENVVSHVLDGRKLLVTAKSASRAIAVIETQAKSARTGRTLPVPGE